MARTTYIRDLEEGQPVSEVFVLESKALSTTRAGKPYLTLMLRDKTGQIEAKVWEEAAAINEQLAGAQFVHVTGSIEVYGKRLQLKVAQLAVKREQDVALDELMATCERDPDEMLDELRAIARTVKNPHLLKLLSAFFKDEEFVARYKRAAGAQSIHHAYVGGLLEHSLSVLKICCALAEHYARLPGGAGINRDLLIAGAILHDVGKIEELETGAAIEYTTPGRLVGHIVLGHHMIEERIARIEGFPDALRLQLGHMLLAHQGQREFGAPVEPSFTEAIVLHYADDLDVKVQQCASAIAAVKDAEADFTDKKHYWLQRYLYTKVEKPEAQEE
jgi:3'-5' exoribonuclease